MLLQCFSQRWDDVVRNVFVDFGEGKEHFATHVRRQKMGRVWFSADDPHAITGDRCTKMLRKGSRNRHDVLAAHAVSDASLRALGGERFVLEGF